MPKKKSRTLVPGCDRASLLKELAALDPVLASRLDRVMTENKSLRRGQVLLREALNVSR